MIDLLQWRSSIGLYHAVQCCSVPSRGTKSKLSAEQVGSVSCCLSFVLLVLLAITLLSLAGDVESNPGPPKMTGKGRFTLET